MVPRVGSGLPGDDPLTTFGVTVGHESLRFRALHFAVHPNGESEALHGHTYRARVSAWGSLDEDGYVIDFAVLKGVAREVCQALDKRVLLPGDNPGLLIRAGEVNLHVAHAQRAYSFPAGEVAVLPLRNTTTELLAHHVARLVLQGLSEHVPAVPALEVSLAESDGQLATVRLNLWPAPLDVIA